MSLFKRRKHGEMKLKTSAPHRSRALKGRFTVAPRVRVRREGFSRAMRVALTALLALGTVAALAWVIYLLGFSGSLRVQRVEVLFAQKTHTVTEAQVEDVLVPVLGKHLLTLDTDAVSAELLRRLPRLRSVEVKKLPPGTLHVDAVEYGRLGVVRQPLTGLSYVVNEGGRVLARSGDEVDGDLRFIVLTTEPYGIDQQVIAPAHLTYLRHFLDDLRTTLTLTPDRTTYDPLAQQARVKVLRGPELWLDFTKDEQLTITDLVQAWRTPQMKGQALQYIDLRLPNGRVVYR